MTAALVGNRIGQYRILRKIGAGGMGTVYLGEHVLLGRRAAIKTLLPALTQHQEIVERFFNEARATSAIADPGVVQVHDFGYHVDGTAYIVMELLEGEALATRLARLGRLAPAEALRITRQVAGALAAAHACAIIHRDLKPENVFLIRDAEAHGGERAKLLDFGICKIDRPDTTLTQTGAMLGTPVYMSPEQCQGAGRIDHRSDIYGLGCVVFQMLTGRTPFEGEGSGELIVAHLQEEPPAPSSFVASIPPAVDALVRCCLEKHPDDRFASMTALQHAIDQLLPELEAASEPVTPPAAQLALGAGFRSNYQASFSVRLADAMSRSVAADDAEPGVVAVARKAYAQLQAEQPTTLRSASGESEMPVRRGGARSTVAIVVAAIAATLVVVRVAAEPEAPVDRAAAAPVEPAPAAPAPVTPDVAPPAGTPAARPPSPRRAIAASSGFGAHARALEPAAAAERRPARVQPPAVKRPAKRVTHRRGHRRRASRSTHSSSSSSSIEELYETR